MADYKGELFIEVGDQEFAQWRHNPLTMAFYAFMSDQAENWTETITERFIAGYLLRGSDHEDMNADVLRGKVLALRSLQSITRREISGFYREKHGLEPEPEQQPDDRNGGPPEGRPG